MNENFTDDKIYFNDFSLLYSISDLISFARVIPWGTLENKLKRLHQKP